MLHAKFHPALKTLLVAAAALLVPMGCWDDDDDDDAVLYTTNGEPYYYTSDYYYTGWAYDDFLYKRSASSPFSARVQDGEQVTEPATYSTECQCSVRKSTFTGDEGFERVRLDSVILLNASGANVQNFNIDSITTIQHIRHVTDTLGGRDADIVYDLTGVISLDTAGIDTTDTTDSARFISVWNGTISGTFNGEAIQGATVDSVVRVWEDSSFGYPIAGSITVERAKATIVINFQPDKTADVNITNKENGRDFTLTIDSTFRESRPVESRVDSL